MKVFDAPTLVSGGVAFVSIEDSTNRVKLLFGVFVRPMVVYPAFFAIPAAVLFDNFASCYISKLFCFGLLDFRLIIFY